MRALDAINKYKSGDMSVLKTERWLLYLALTDEHRVNPERLSSMKQTEQNYILEAVARQLTLLYDENLTEAEKSLVEETIKWSEAAKGGLSHRRRLWVEAGYNLFVHNIGSAQIYGEESRRRGDYSPVVETLIATHGLLGQTIRGEVVIKENMPLYSLIKSGLVKRQSLENVLRVLNRCIIAGIDDTLWQTVRDTIFIKIANICDGCFENEATLEQRLRALRSVSIKAGEDFDGQFKMLAQNAPALELLGSTLKRCDLWFVEAALYDFSFEEFIKVFLLAGMAVKAKKVQHLSFEKTANGLYYDRNGKKRINLYKKRIIEKYLGESSFDDILNGITHESPHICFKIEMMPQLDDTAFAVFEFSLAGERLIDFCTEAEKAGVVYEKSIVMLYDLFGLRKDAYDRFYEEDNYLQTMNKSVDGKKVLLNYITGKNFLDIGPGGGALMDLIEEKFRDADITGIDIAENVIEALRRKKQRENRRWNVKKGDAFNLKSVIEQGGADTIIFCSIIHELYSYIPTGGHRFNTATIAAALKSAFEVLSPGGRILIRDGIMTEPRSLKRRIRFASAEGMEFLRRYASDFKGRQIEYECTGRNEVIMPINDAMEFLYTYTWGEESYVHEINEQFGYFTPTQYADFIEKALGSSAKIIKLEHYLQEGYTLALSPKIELSDEVGRQVSLPDSTCLIVIEKTYKKG